jgi:predicted  nucleic acid-binding Zn-ribbon protein
MFLELQEEMRQLKKNTMNTRGLNNNFRNELNSMTNDIDELNKEKQANAIELEHLKRYISQLEVEKVEENESNIAVFGRKLEHLEASADRTNQRMKKMGRKSNDNEKVDLLLKEVQSVKNQVYFLQQAILQMRAQVPI